MRTTRPIREFMSHLPAEVDRRETLGAALDRMRAERVHHVPVLDGPALVGILSRDDAHEAWLRDGAAAAKRTVGEVCTTQPLTVGPLTPLRDVANAMVERGVASALVVDGAVLVGIFTSTDALRLLAEASSGP